MKLKGRQLHRYLPGSKCTVSDCSKRPEDNWMCGAHAQRVRRYGDPFYLTPEQKRRETNRVAQLVRHDGKSTWYRKFHGRHEHRVAMEKHLGRALESCEIVHHIDGNKRNNKISNLQIMTQSEHAKLHRGAHGRYH